MARDTVNIVVGCDCDPDRLVFGGADMRSKKGPLVWKGLTVGVPLLLSLLDDLPFFVPVTWNVRCDDQLLECCGDPGWSITEHASIWKRCVDRDDEIAWHNHTLRYSGDRGCWHQEISDESWISDRFAAWGEVFAESWGQVPYTSHGGWFFQNDSTLAALSKVGVKLDYSALPGRSQHGFSSIEGSDFVNHYDWSVSPRTPYHPSIGDYRRPAGDGERSLPIVVAPTYTFRSFTGSLFQKLSYMTRRKGGGSVGGNTQSPMSVVTVTNHPFFFSGLIDFALMERPKAVFLYFHPDELLPEKPNLKTRLFSAKNMIRNVCNLYKGLKQGGLNPVFVKAQDAIIPENVL